MTSPDAPATSTGAPALDDVWGQATDTDFAPDCSPTKVCRNAREFTFDGIADDGGDLAGSWRRLLEAEGKAAPGGASLRDLVLGTGPAD